MNDKACTSDPRNWWNSYQFPLVPVLRFRKKDEHNAAKLTFSWLFLTLWTLEHLSISIEAHLDTHWGFGLVGTLPYLRWSLTIPFPRKWGYAFDRITRRNP